MPQDLPEGKPEKKDRSRLLGWLLIGFIAFVWFVMHHTAPPSQPEPTPPASQAAPSQPKSPATPPPAATKPAAPKPEAPWDPKAYELQLALGDAGQHVEITGHMDAQTKQAVIAFQRAHHLTPDGVVGPQTQRALERATAPPSSSSSAESPSCEQTFGDFCLVKQWTSSDDVAGYIEGTIRNDSDRPYSYVQVEVNTYDASGTTQVSSEMDNVNNLAAHGTWHFKVMIMRDTPGGRYRIVGVTGW
jgi:hypothetical protein